MSPQEQKLFKLVLVDDDPVFRLGMRRWLNQFADLEVVDEAESGTVALMKLDARLGSTQDSTERAAAPATELGTESTAIAQTASAKAIDLVILDLSLGQAHPAEIQGLNLCERIKAQHPDLPILLLSSVTEPVMLAAAQMAGADGFCAKSVAVADLGHIIRQVALGQSYWPQLSRSSELVGETGDRGAQHLSQASQSPELPSPLAIVRRNMRLSGIRQIEATLAEIIGQLQNLELSLLERAILAGRVRELRTARWLVQRLLATPSLVEPPPKPTPQPPSVNSTTLPPAPTSPSRVSAEPSSALSTTMSTTTAQSLEQSIRARSVQGLLFDTALSKFQTSLINQTEAPLEIDILREDKKRELFYLILRKLEDALDELRYSQVQPDQLRDKRSPILIDLWQATTTDFFGKYYTVTVRQQNVEVVGTLLQDVEVVQTELLQKIPMVLDLLAHLLFQIPLQVNSVSCAVGNPESLLRAEALLDNLLIQVANSVMQPLLNRLADVEEIKQNFYDRRLMSNREIERFRNNLSWKYRVGKYVGEPKDIFESQYRLLVLQGAGIKQLSVYAPRGQELDQLSGVQFFITLALETRDAIAPRLRSAASVVGSSLVYLLTEVIGRGIGLVGRGVLKGIGNVWQDGRR